MCRREIPHRTYTADEWRNQGHISLSTCNSLAETEQQGQVGADLVITLKLSCGLDALPKILRDAVLVQVLLQVDRDTLEEAILSNIAGQHAEDYQS